MGCETGEWKQFMPDTQSKRSQIGDPVGGRRRIFNFIESAPTKAFVSL